MELSLELLTKVTRRKGFGEDGWRRDGRRGD